MRDQNIRETAGRNGISRGRADRSGRAITLEFVPNEDRVSPPGQAMFNLIMLATTPRGRAYSFGELDGMFQSAGFSRSELHDVPGMDQRIVVSWR